MCAVSVERCADDDDVIDEENIGYDDVFSMLIFSNFQRYSLVAYHSSVLADVSATRGQERGDTEAVAW